MSVVGIALERPDSPTIDASLNQRHYTRKWRVDTNDYADGPDIATAAPGIPRLWTPYLFGNEADIYALLRQIEAERIQPNSLTWLVTGHYSTPEPYRRDRPAGGERDSATDNPLLQLPEIETSFEKFQDVIYSVYDIVSGVITPCRASNDEVFVPPPAKDASRLVLTISRNETIDQPHPAADIVFIDTVNSDIFWGCSAGVWKCMGISARRETKQLQDKTILPYLKVTYKFEARVTWDILLLDAGTYYYKGGIGSLGTTRAIMTGDGHPIAGPLNGSGDKLTPGATPVFLAFRVYQRQPFGVLNLPQSFADVA